MNISNQNNERIGQTLHNKSIGPKGAVSVLARRVAHIMSRCGAEEHLLCEYLQQKLGKRYRALTSWIQLEERQKISNYTREKLILTFKAHSLREGGDMALKIMG